MPRLVPIIAATLLILLVIVGCSVGQAQSTTSATSAEAGSCKISFVDEKYAPEFRVNQHALEVPERSQYQKAYFAMGCFWGSEALLASAPGVVSTQVGFSGGTHPDPSYRAIGDHVETVEVLYNPKIMSYDELLRHFWSHHNARAKPIFRQYASAIFCAKPSEIELAKKEREAWQARGQEKVLTAILPLIEFHPAAENHQKYYLQQDPVLLESLPAESRLDTILATKLNAVSGRAGDRKTLEETLTAFGIDEAAQQVLFARAVWKDD